MSMRFGWTRPQSTPLLTDDEGVEDVSTPRADVTSDPAPSRSGPVDALRDATSRTGDPPPAPSAAVLDVWQLHERVLDTERKARRLLSGGTARREHHDAVVAGAWLAKTAHECTPAEAYALGMLAEVERDSAGAATAEFATVWETARRKRLRRWF